jgi:hypothetical protein
MSAFERVDVVMADSRLQDEGVWFFVASGDGFLSSVAPGCLLCSNDNVLMMPVAWT